MDLCNMPIDFIYYLGLHSRFCKKTYEKPFLSIEANDVVARVLISAMSETCEVHAGLLFCASSMISTSLEATSTATTEAALRRDEYYPLAHDGYFAVIEATHLTFYSSLV